METIIEEVDAFKVGMVYRAPIFVYEAPHMKKEQEEREVREVH